MKFTSFDNYQIKFIYGGKFMNEKTKTEFTSGVFSKLHIFIGESICVVSRESRLFC